MSTVYVLELTGGKYYVGRTHDLKARYMDHVSGRSGAAWTRRYSPIRVLVSYDECDAFEEDKRTLEMMSEKGYENVRGGAYVTMELGTSARAEIVRRIRMAHDLCVRCGSSDHFVSDCSSTVVPSVLWEALRCDRCGRDRHVASECRFSTHSDGTSLGA